MEEKMLRRSIIAMLLVLTLLGVGFTPAHAEASSDSPKPGDVIEIGEEDITGYQCWWYLDKYSELLSCGHKQRTIQLTKGETVEVIKPKISHWLWSRIQLLNGDVWWVWTADLPH